MSKRGRPAQPALTEFNQDDVQHFDIAREASIAVLHVWDKLHTLDLSDANAKPRPLAITAPADTDGLILVQPLKNKANEAVLSPDGKVMAVSIRGELFVKTLDSKNPPQRITRHVARDHQPVWSADGQTLYFTSDRDGTLSIYQASVTLTRSEIEEAVAGSVAEQADDQAEPLAEQAEPAAEDESESSEEAEQADENAGEAEEDAEQEAAPNPADRWHDAMRFEITPAVQTADHDADPSPSPDGKTLAFRRGNGRLMLLDLETKRERTYLDQWDRGLHWAWSSDGQYLAVSYEDQDHNADIWVGPADGSTPSINITKHPAQDVLPSFSLDSKVLTFVSARNDRNTTSMRSIWTRRSNRTRLSSLTSTTNRPRKRQRSASLCARFKRRR